MRKSGVRITESRWHRTTALVAALCLLSAAGARGEASCGDVLKVPKVALMFMVRGGLPLAPVWDAWLKPLAGLVPLSTVTNEVCVPDKPPTPCQVAGGSTALQRQFLYSVHIHSSQINFTDFPAGDPFQGTLIKELTKAVWGDTSLAARNLLKTALADPLNQKFVMLSDSDVPIYPARLVYLQLMVEDKSRLAACQAYDMANINRYTCKMSGEGIHIHHWRKNSLWFAITRAHAEMIANEEAVRKVFADHCSGVLFDKTLGRYRGCLVDEHYYGTLMAKMGKTQETDCKGIVSISDFSKSVRGHPKMYVPEECNVELLARLRYPLGWLGKAFCANETTWVEAQENFLKLEEVLADHSPEKCAAFKATKPYAAMESWCQLFARKFRQDTSEAVLKMFTGINKQTSFE